MKFHIYWHGEAADYRVVLSFWRLTFYISSYWQLSAGNYEGVVVVCIGWLEISYWKQIQ